MPRLLRWALKTYGVKGTLAVVPRFLFTRARAYAIERIEGFDRRYGTDTTGWVEVASMNLSDADRAGARAYHATPMRVVRDAMRHVDVASGDFAFVDYGCGKGRVCLLAADWPFERIVGIDLNESLVHAARRNASIYQGERQRCSVFDFQHRNALDFDPPVQNTVFYFFSPFAISIVKDVLARIGASLPAHPRRIYVIFVGDEATRAEVATTPWLERTHDGSSLGMGTWSLYQGRPSLYETRPQPDADTAPDM